MVKYSKHGLRMAELWLDQPVVTPGDVDVVLLQQYSVAPPGAVSLPFHSLVIDLTQPEEAILGRFESSVKYQVRRAQTKDAVHCVHEQSPDETVFEEFRAFFDEFAAGKGLPGVARAEFQARARGGALRFSRALYRDSTVVWHVHAITAASAALLYSASLFRQEDDKDVRAAIGRANKLLHWVDMQTFKAEGRTTYDFGGWYAGSEDPALLSINVFKERFGGERVQQVNAAIPVNWRGSVYLRLRQLLSGKQRKAFALLLHRLGARS